MFCWLFFFGNNFNKCKFRRKKKPEMLKSNLIMKMFGIFVLQGTFQTRSLNANIKLIFLSFDRRKKDLKIYNTEFKKKIGIYKIL